MAKVSEYKVTKVYTKNGDGEYEFLCSDIIDALLIAKKKHKSVYAAFVLKRRQTVDTWVSQISKYVWANQSKLGDFIDAVDFELAGTYTNDEGVEETLIKLF